MNNLTERGGATIVHDCQGHCVVAILRILVSRFCLRAGIVCRTRVAKIPEIRLTVLGTIGECNTCPCHMRFKKCSGQWKYRDVACLTHNMRTGSIGSRQHDRVSTVRVVRNSWIWQNRTCRRTSRERPLKRSRVAARLVGKCYRQRAAPTRLSGRKCCCGRARS